MKKILMVSMFVLTYGIIAAQDRATDEVAINSQIDAMIKSWNNHNYDDLKEYTTEDTDWVNVVGMWWKGRKQSQYAHQELHKTMFKESVCTKKSTQVRFITKDVAIVHVVWHFAGPPMTAPDGRKFNEPSDGLAQLVYVNKNGKWLMTAGENVMINEPAQQTDPVKTMPKN